jgi:hypothetical protein
MQLRYCQDCGQLRSQTGQGHRCPRRAGRTSTSTPAPGAQADLDGCARPSGSWRHRNPTVAGDLRVLRPLTSGVPSSAAPNLQQLAPTTATQTDQAISGSPLPQQMTTAPHPPTEGLPLPLTCAETPGPMIALAACAEKRQAGSGIAYTTRQLLRDGLMFFGMTIGQWLGCKACCMWCRISDNEHPSEGSVRADLACVDDCGY